ncbi:peroxide stress protein YaaA [Dinoroseobacter sp. S375]|uniref:peroxide stress protein YaaA n=1 Tax=Dinoroseobacter sp. S375 TaxID=3415136 RepID=UPI003C79E4CE
MLTVISPAKRLDWTVPVPAEATLPDFQDSAVELAAVARKLKLGELQKLMGLSEDLARLNTERFAAFEADADTDAARPAALAFAGDTYVGLEAGTLSEDEMRYAQDHLRILSGLYGILRPLDLIQAYRLEMGSRLKTERGKNLYDWWGDRIARALNEAATATGSRAIVNCASQEYFGAVDLEALTVPVLTPVFLEDRDGAAKTVSFFAKKARGAMARYVVQNRVTETAGLQDFEIGGYAFDPDRSTAQSPVFVRPYPEPAKKPKSRQAA